MVRTVRRRRTPGRFWSEIGVSAGVLLVPPMLVGGAVYGLLPSHDDGAARSVASAVLEPPPADFNSRSAFDTGPEPPPAVAALVAPTTNAFVTAYPAMQAATQPAAAAAAATNPAVSSAATQPALAAKADPPPAAANKPAAAKGDAPPVKPAAAPVKATREPATFALASEHSELVGKVGKEATRALGPVPVQVTVVVAPNTAEAERREPVALGAAPPSTIAASPSTPDAAPPGAAAERSAGERSTEQPREHRARHAVHSHFRHLARRKEGRPEAHAQEPATQRPVEPPPQQHEFSLRRLFQQDQSGRQKGAVRG